MLALNPRATLRHLLEQRRPFYEEVAVVTVATDGRTPAEITDEVAERLAEHAAERERGRGPA